MLFKKRSGFSIINLLIVLSIIVTISALNFNVDILKVTDNLSDNEIKQEAFTIDHALSQYASSHSGDYPSSLQILIDSRILSPIVNINQYTYSPSSSGYKLSIKLNDNSTYISPLSSN